MEGLLLAEAVSPLRAGLPWDRGAWRFPDERTAVLPLRAAGDLAGMALWIFSRPPSPWLAVMSEIPADGRPRTSFQEQLSARAAGPLTAVRQQQLDRVVELGFGATSGFVPQPPVALVVELTGRNANLLLLDEERTIAGVERPVPAERNRYRELRAGRAYRPPPPYRKLDPRVTPPEVLRRALLGTRLGDLRGLLDGIGSELTRALAVGCGLEVGTRLQGASLERVVTAVAELAAAPSRWLERAGGSAGRTAERQRDQRERALALLREAARRRLVLAERRLQDVERSQARGAEVGEVRAEADLLMAYAASVPGGARRATLVGFDGVRRELELDPRVDAFANARKRYRRARRLQERVARAHRERPRLEAERRAARAELEGLDRVPERELERRAAALSEERQHRRPSPAGVRFEDPRGFEVVVGRNARENEAVTFGVARSRDLWLHVQGFGGAHVVVRGGGREVPFETVLFAARLAAGFSPARHSDNVAVDYTLRKYVWKVRGMPAGTVHFSRQKTVFVTPARSAGAATGRPAEGPEGVGR